MIKQDIYDEVQKLEPFLQEVSRHIWNHPEASGQEIESSKYYRKVLNDYGFHIHDNDHLPTAFYAEYGEGKPVIAILGEYDALPGLSQKVCTTKNAVVEGGPGHGCGHNLLGSAAVTAAIAIKSILAENNIQGTVRFYGCPEEELLEGKVKMIADHMFDGCDVALSWHPSDSNMTHDRGYLANTSMKFYFSGKTAHAAFAPQNGRSALDAVELMNVGCNYLREHVVDRTRIHYTTDSGGFAPNIVPDKASAWYYIRAPRVVDVKDTARRVELVAKGAAMMTETEVKIEHGYGCCEFKENTAFSDLNYANLIEADGPKYTKEELDFAKEVQATIDQDVVARSQASYGQDQVLFMGVASRDAWKENGMTASSDSGDVSYVIPTGLFTTVCWPLGCSPHTWQAASSAGTTIGEKGALYAAKVLAGSAYDILTQPNILKKIKKEFDDRQDTPYEAMLADNR